MTFLRNAWYAAAWSSELADGTLARTFLDEPVVLFRGEDGKAVALADMCPHRFAPLSLGRIGGDTIRCPYHGLVFDKTGACVHNPHGRGVRPSSLSVRSYPVLERDSVLWIWMGDAALAGATPPPSFAFLDKDGWATIRGMLGVGANYELVTDNLMDLSHAEFLHPFIAPEGSAAGIRYRAEQDDDRVAAIHDMPDQPNTPLFELLLGKTVTRIDGYANTYWEAPANMRLETCATAIEPADGGRAEMLQAHLLTPETETSTHYFWAISRDLCLDDPELEAMLRFGIDAAFRNEDEPMIQAVQGRMRGRPLMDMSPALLPMDEAAVRARRILARRIAEEQKVRAVEARDEGQPAAHACAAEW
ncbi:aromatic ring-hydroxylating dioxygenase subunit alpha [Sphingomonas sp. YL-JM2C]